MKRYAALLCVILSAGCSNHSAIEQAVRDGLVDPESAKFGDIIEYTKDGSEMACVMVNARNRMGGYTRESIMLVKHINDEGWFAVGAGPDNYVCAEYLEDVVKPDTD